MESQSGTRADTVNERTVVRVYVGQRTRDDVVPECLSAAQALSAKGEGVTAGKRPGRYGFHRVVR